ncbi:SCO family protein [Aureibacillus halotolerans]|uniref:Protein SCO1/2 n=1 Tax=Aureibacillus halotolerans TaxID=1508390 RepID=A0A4R6UA75_9BACI|nr:SCO family protein [Aureibacillus halotolerans]TDQ42752.1 protein SCO1/2 [Aureibacillus halotolerans]
MKFSKAYIGIPLIVVTVVLLAFVIWMTFFSPEDGNTSQSSGPATSVSFSEPIAPFSGVNQNNEPFSTDDLKGKTWIADFIFTNCPDVCPPMTFNMQTLQEKVEEAGLDVTFVSFTVDPERDSPEVLTEFGTKFQADFSNWHFITGYTHEEVKEYSKTSFKSSVQKLEDTFMHGVHFFLVRPDGYINSYYVGNIDPPFDQIIADIKAVQEKAN